MLFASVVFLILASLVAFANIVGVVAAEICHWRGIKGGYSCIPILSITFSLAAYAFGRSTIGLWTLLPAALDPGTWALIAWPIDLLVKRSNGANE